MAERRLSTWRGTFISSGLILLGTFLCLGGLLVGLNAQCRAEIDAWLPVYPGATLVEKRYNFLLANAMGITHNDYLVSAPEPLVRAWYRRVTRMTDETRRLIGMATVRWQAERRPTGETHILLWAECANS